MPLLSLALVAALVQGADRFVVVATNREVADMASATVTGPRNARSLVMVSVPSTPFANGWNSFIGEVVADCDAGTLQYVSTRAFIDDALVSTRPAQPAKVPVAGAMDAAVLDYACTGRTASSDRTQVIGIAAAKAYARKVVAR